MRLKNPFLSMIGVQLRQDRPDFPVDHIVEVSEETVDERQFVRAWFRTMGCTYDRQGLCTMCNYGRAEGVPESVVEEMERALAKHGVHPDATILMSPSGSMFDRREVPPEICEALLKLTVPAATVICETRPETVTPEAMNDFVEAVGGAQAEIEMGLESSDPWVLKWCVNKKMALGDFLAAMSTCHEAGIGVTANVSLGTAFLTPAAAIRDAVETAQWAIDSGVDACVIFPMQVRAHTLLGWLFREGRYEPPSLWSLIHVLEQIEQRRPGQVSTAWYRDYYEDEGEGRATMRVISSPDSCDQCRSKLLQALDDFRGSGDHAALSVAARRLQCGCREHWVASLGNSELNLALVEDHYRYIGNLLRPDWWQLHGSSLLHEMASDLARRTR